MNMSSSSDKRKRLNAEEKYKASLWIKRQNASIDEIIRELGVKSTLAKKLKKNADMCIQEYESSDVQTGFKKSKKHGKFETVEQCLVLWIRQLRAQNVPVSGELIKVQAELFSSKLGIAEICKWSNGWLERFKFRAGLKSHSLHGEAADADFGAALVYSREEIPKIIRDKSTDDIFNADETGLFWRCLPTRTFDLARNLRGETLKGSKKLKDRVTFLAMVNASGTEKYGLVIGTAKNPRSFRNKIFPKSLKYYFSKNGWMTSIVWTKFFDDLNAQMRMQNRKILVLVDNFSGHVLGDWSNIRIQFLPPNTTSIIQPCDQGVINSLKGQYRKRMLRRIVDLIEEMDAQITASDLCKKLNLFDACTMLEDAWKNVSSSCIQNCWRKAGFIFEEVEIEDTEDQAADIEEEIVKLLENLGIDPPIAESQARSLLEVGIEEENIISDLGETLEEEIINVVTGGCPDEDATCDVDPDEPEEILNPVSAKAAISALHTVNQWCSENGFKFNADTLMATLRDQVRISRVQTVVSDFFQPSPSVDKVIRECC